MSWWTAGDLLVLSAASIVNSWSISKLTRQRRVVLVVRVKRDKD